MFIVMYLFTDLLLNVQIFEETDTSVKVHYVGYDNSWDQWINKDSVVQKRHNLVEIPLDIELEHIKSKLELSIKDHLTFHRSHDPVVVLNLDC